MTQQLAERLPHLSTWSLPIKSVQTAARRQGIVNGVTLETKSMASPVTTHCDGYSLAYELSARQTVNAKRASLMALKAN